MRQRDWIGVVLVLVGLAITASGREWTLLVVEIVLCAVAAAVIIRRRRSGA